MALGWHPGLFIRDEEAYCDICHTRRNLTSAHSPSSPTHTYLWQAGFGKNAARTACALWSQRNKLCRDAAESRHLRHQRHQQHEMTDADYADFRNDTWTYVPSTTRVASSLRSSRFSRILRRHSTMSCNDVLITTSGSRPTRERAACGSWTQMSFIRSH